MFFLDSSIKNNISLNINDKKVSQKKLDHSIEVAQLKNFIDNLEDGQDTIIGEDGSRLSGGQRQRIAIARALYREHSILVLDEITSSLDQVTEEKIMNSIYNLNDKTVIVISHRLQSLRGCNKIIKINNGMITKVGTYEEIIGTN
jgi:ABC-type multidrug transport system fused ATPase/permease subunit